MDYGTLQNVHTTKQGNSIVTINMPLELSSQGNPYKAEGYMFIIHGHSRTFLLRTTITLTNSSYTPSFKRYFFKKMLSWSCEVDTLALETVHMATVFLPPMRTKTKTENKEKQIIIPLTKLAENLADSMDTMHGANLLLSQQKDAKE